MADIWYSMVKSDFHVGLAEDPQNKKEIQKSIRKVKMNETEKENVKEAEEEDEEGIWVREQR